MNKKIYYYIDEIESARHGDYVDPVSCEIDPSNACMLNCRWCMYKEFLRENHQFLGWDEYTGLLGDLITGGTKSITFTGGGEPLLHPRFNEMLALALDAGFEVGLVTNGILLDRVSRINRFKFIRISLDAPDRETYLKIKGGDYFDRVIRNTRTALETNPTVGISYVIFDENSSVLEAAADLADLLKVAYIQFKPAHINGNIFTDYELPGGRAVIGTDRFKARDMLPCAIAQLVGIVGASGDIYYCCQHRGKAEYTLGNLHNQCFREIWRKRNEIIPDLENCPQCRYMNYAVAYQDVIKSGRLFFDHRRFL